VGLVDSDNFLLARARFATANSFRLSDESVLWRTVASYRINWTLDVPLSVAAATDGETIERLLR